MKFQDFIQASEQLDSNFLQLRMEIREIENRIIQNEPNPVQEWSQSQHKEAIQKVKQHFDMRGIEYISC
jgi:hypothetical protein